MENELNASVLYIASDELAYNYSWEKESDYLKSGLKVISIDEIETCKERGYIFDINSSIEEGMMLTAHPFKPRTYIDMNRTEYDLIREKMGCISKVAQKIGATKISGHAILTDRNTLFVNSFVEGKFKAVEAKISYSEEDKEEYSKTYHIERTFNGHYDKTSYSDAQKLIRQYGLMRDPEVNDLVELRNPSESNEIISQNVKMEASREINSLKEIAFSINAMQGLFNLGGNLQKTISTLSTVVLSLDIEF